MRRAVSSTVLVDRSDKSENTRSPLKRTIVGAVGRVVCLVGIATANGQAAQQQRPQLAEEVFKNDQIFAKYLQALGGAERLASLTSFVAKGTYSGYDTDQAKAAIEIYAKAPAQRTTIVHAPFGDSVRVYDGRAAWIASPDKPLPLIPLTGGNLEGAKIEAMVSFPTPIKQAFNQWRVTTTTIDDREVTVLQGTNPEQPR